MCFVYIELLPNILQLSEETGVGMLGKQQNKTIQTLILGKEIKYYNNVEQKIANFSVMLDKSYVWMGLFLANKSVEPLHPVMRFPVHVGIHKPL